MFSFIEYLFEVAAACEFVSSTFFIVGCMVMFSLYWLYVVDEFLYDFKWVE